MRLMMLGDTHGSNQFIHGPLKVARRQKVDAIVQVGDFGFIWRDETNRLDSFQNVRKQFGSIPFFFLDGNHEDHDVLAEMGATPDAEAFVEIAPGLTYLPRGFTWEWDGIQFMSMGGATSVDVDPDPSCFPPWKGRTLGFDWFQQETISYRDVNRAIAKGKVDVLLSHDVPEIPAFLGERLGYLKEKIERASRSNRLALAAIAEEVRPELIVHGHYHFRYNDFWQDSVVCGLGHHRHGQSQYVTIDTERFTEHVEEVRESIQNRCN